MEFGFDDLIPRSQNNMLVSQKKVHGVTNNLVIKSSVTIEFLLLSLQNEKVAFRTCI
jgi:hypothetical protein